MSSFISIVIPTYNRADQLGRVIEHILESDTTGIDGIEIIVVDDGSHVPVKNVVEALQTSPPFSLTYIYQTNSGPAQARNRGFKAATGEIVLFLDDDILLFPESVKAHMDAHKKFSGSAIYGKTPYLPPARSTPAFRYLNGLTSGDYEALGSEPDTEFVKIDVVASANLSVERNLFETDDVYNVDLAKLGEEYDLEHRLNGRGIPIYLLNKNTGWHLQPTTINDKCVQEFKYGIGAAEAWRKIPGIETNPHLFRFVVVNGPFDSSRDGIADRMKKGVKSIISREPVRKSLLKLTNIFESILPFDFVLFRCYRVLCGIHFFAGFREGLRFHDERAN